MDADHLVVPAIKQALSMLPQPWSQKAMLTSNDYKELAAKCTELASESSDPTVAEALRALASDYLARAAKLVAPPVRTRWGRGTPIYLAIIEIAYIAVIWTILLSPAAAKPHCEWKQLGSERLQICDY
jgi:hypothetical protein